MQSDYFMAVRRVLSRLFFGVVGTLMLGFLVSPGFGQGTTSDWDGVVGKKVVNRQGVTLGHAADTVLDLEQGRYVGIVVVSPGFLGLGSRVKVVPAGAFTDDGVHRTLVLDVDEVRFKNAPSIKMSKTLGPPDAGQLAAVYRYYGQRPYFSTEIESSPSAGQTREQLGFVERGTKILNLPVDNLQGETLGRIYGFRDLNRRTGRFKGVIIRSYEHGTDGDKIVEPEDLRYNLSFNRVRINNREQSYANTPDFRFLGGGSVLEDEPERPGEPRIVVVQGNSARDKRITSKIIQGILQSPSLSHHGKNIAVGTVHGKTIVRGQVETEGDRREVESLAARAAGRANVTSILEVGTISRRENRVVPAGAAPGPAPVRRTTNRYFVP